MKHQPAAVPPPIIAPPRRGLRREEAAGYIGVSPSKFDEMIREGQMPPPIKIGRISVWDLRKLDLAFEALNDEAANDWD